MDYEKKYNEALERARRILCNIPEGSPIIRDIETIFPELVESEDERIRKELVQFLTDVKNISEGGRDSWHVRKEDAGMCDSFLAYLEKQKEQKPAWSEEEVLNRTYEEGFNDGLKYRKPVKRSDEDKKMSDWLIGLVNANTELSFKDKVTLTRWLEHLTIEKELSKNDKRIIDAIMIGYQDKDFHSSQIPTPIGVSKDEVIDWLKSLRPQSKQEWSEEDEEIFNNIIEKAKGGHWIEVNEITWLIDRFKSPHPSWKPSEEQMEALRNSAYGIYQNGDGPALRELYEQLKKL